MATRPTTKLDLRDELTTDKLPFIGTAAEWTRRIDNLLGGNVSSEISVASTWAQATIWWRGQHFVILMKSVSGDECIDYIDCTRPGPGQTVTKSALWEAALKPILLKTAHQHSADWQQRMEAIEQARF